jgi:hypothetical protein
LISGKLAVFTNNEGSYILIEKDYEYDPDTHGRIHTGSIERLATEEEIKSLLNFTFTDGSCGSSTKHLRIFGFFLPAPVAPSEGKKGPMTRSRPSRRTREEPEEDDSDDEDDEPIAAVDHGDTGKQRSNC